MSHQPRDAEPGSFLHVCTRGNSRCSIYQDEVDRAAFLTMLDRRRRKYNWHLYAWCLMTNHYHLVLSIPDGGLSLGMCELNGGFARWSNKRYGPQNHLFGKRFASTLIESDDHLLEAIRYVVLNPVRAGICKRPEDWPGG